MAQRRRGGVADSRVGSLERELAAAREEIEAQRRHSVRAYEAIALVRSELRQLQDPPRPLAGPAPAAAPATAPPATPPPAVPPPPATPLATAPPPPAAPPPTEAEPVQAE